LHHAATGLTTV
jgi:ribulose kinase